MLKYHKIPKLFFSKIFIFLLVLSVFDVHSQVLTDSNLPIVVITTDNDPVSGLPLEILDDPKILASMKIIKHPDGTRNYLTDINTAAYLNYNGRIGIELRGSSSQSLPKKPYGLTTLKDDNVSNNNVSLLGMPSENDWVLNALAFDSSLMRDYLSYNLSNKIGQYATRTEYCEVVVNGRYVGLYILQEKIKSNSNRVNILKIAAADVTDPDVTGGYITKCDKTTGGDPIAWWMTGGTTFIHELPKPTAVTFQQNTYIRNQFTQLESTANNTDLVAGYPSVIDVPTFVDFMLLNEFASNADGYQYSTFFHKDRGGKLRAGPIWDFNLTYGNDLPGWVVRSKSNVWQFADGENEGARFWRNLFNNVTFKCYLAKRWNEVTQSSQPLNFDEIDAFINKTVNYISEAAVRENQKWGTVPDHTLSINNLKAFVWNRISWMNTNIGSFSDCSAIAKPALVISKINYNPSVSESFAVSNDLEFIEITNTGSTTIDLTGVYLKELGVSYQFPANSSISANSRIYLTSNPTVFSLKYGVTAFGKFTRNLSNSSQKIVLADGLGNTIDSVEYFDAAPWATEADGNGSYLKLIDNALDNSLASSWVAVSDDSLSTSSFELANSIAIHPNPVKDILNIESKTPITGVKVFNVLGILINEIKSDSEIKSYDLSSCPSGVYLVTLYNSEGSVTKKIIKD